MSGAMSGKRRPVAKPARVRNPAGRRHDSEPARLRRELDEALQQQAASAAVLKAISRSTFDLQSVLDTLLESVVRLCGADLAAMHRHQGAHFRTVAVYGGPPSHGELARSVPFAPGRDSVIGRVVMERKAVQVVDVLADPDYRQQDAQKRMGYRTVLGVPLLREDHPFGVIVLMRFRVNPFTDKQIALVQNFAAKAVVATENARLLSELRHRTDELGRLVAELKRERSGRLMSLEAMAASIAHEVRQPLASITVNGAAAVGFLEQAPPDLDELKSALNRMVAEAHRASDVFDGIRALFGKPEQSHALCDLNELVSAVLDGLRGELTEHGITPVVDLAADLPPVMGHSDQLHEVFVNLVRNAIAAIDAAGDGRRNLKIRTERVGANKIGLAVEDSGAAIHPRKLDNLIGTFVTTKDYRMGLGIALCRMIVDRHAGQLSLGPAQPRGSIFRVVLPAAPRHSAEAGQ